MTKIRIDLYSDTKTRPTAGMRHAIANAEVGDEQHHEDPTVNSLLERMAALLGQEAAMFLPSGTMANQIAMILHCQPGDEIIAHEMAHLINGEGGGPAANAGAMVRPITGAKGHYDVEALERAIRPDSKYQPFSRVALIEQTANLAGGFVWPLDQMQRVASYAHSRNLLVHMDGARLMNAAVKSGRKPSDFSSLADSVYFDFTKGLGCPVGAVLGGSKPFIARAWRIKQRIGGSMRQAGILAAACHYALDHHVDRLAEDHENAALLGRELARIEGITVEPGETNMVFFDVKGTGLTAAEFNARLLPHGMRTSPQAGTQVRAVTHLDVPRELILEAVEIIRGVVSEIGKA